MERATLTFRVEYKTQWGEDLRLKIGEKEYPMHTDDGIIWSAEFQPDTVEANVITYCYALYRENKLVWTEWERHPHRITLRDGGLLVDDLWRPIPDDMPLFTSAITQCINPHTKVKEDDLPCYGSTLALRVVDPRIPRSHRLAISGNTKVLGNWQSATPLSYLGMGEWGINIDQDALSRKLEYKYVLVDVAGNISQWEDGSNRSCDTHWMKGRQMWQKTDERPRLNFPRWKCAGIVAPVFSLRSNKSYGIGDFGDLERMVRWAASVGMHAVQILPIQDTTMAHNWTDSYPYNAISIYALNPIYADLASLTSLNNRYTAESFEMRRVELNALESIDYEQVEHLKTAYLRQLYEQEGTALLATESFKRFFTANRHWLAPYAAFCFLRDENHTAEYKNWGRYAVYDEKAIARLTSPRGKNYHDIAFHYYVQYTLHLQLSRVHKSASALGVILKGDIPIGISRTSVEAWTSPQLFNLDSSAGAPPDDFSVNGQNWGFPTYNWEAMAKDGLAWWNSRMQHMQQYFDAYRIDHILGFFRIWAIPLHSVHGLLGQFAPSLPMSQSEIESFGLHFDAERMTRPLITDDILFHLFSYRAELVKTLYLTPLPSTADAGQNAFGGTETFYALRPEVDTQQKIQALFAQRTNPDDISLRDGMYRLVSNVLFVPDRQRSMTNGKYAILYHPRIAAQSDFAYKQLSSTEQHAFDRLYNHYYYERHNDFWYDIAMQRLSGLTQHNDMLPCAEDLGMVPQCVAPVMQRLRILSLEIQTMPKKIAEFGDPAENPWLSVSTISTHDMPTMRGWWEEDAERAQRFYTNALHIDGIAPEKQPTWLSEEIVRRHLYSPSMLCLLSLQDWLAISDDLRSKDPAADRINIPSNPRHYWRWRMPMTIEALASHTDFGQRISSLIQQSGR